MSTLFQVDIERWAKFSPCEKYRYELGRRWDSALPCGLVLGINPSIASADDEDQTTRKLNGFTERFGWGGYVIANPFALIATKAKELLAAADPIGPDNDETLARLLDERSPVVCAWGNKSGRLGRLLARRIEKLRSRLLGYDLRRFDSGDGSYPPHPLMLPYSTKLVRFQI